MLNAKVCTDTGWWKRNKAWGTRETLLAFNDRTLLENSISILGQW
jgi:hypothetical protein